jgi:hypothetical protein
MADVRRKCRKVLPRLTSDLAVEIAVHRSVQQCRHVSAAVLRFARRQGTTTGRRSVTAKAGVSHSRSTRRAEVDVELPRSNAYLHAQPQPRRLGRRRSGSPTTERRRSTVAVGGPADRQGRGCPRPDPGTQPPAVPWQGETAGLHGGVLRRADCAAAADSTTAARRPTASPRPLPTRRRRDGTTPLPAGVSGRP